MNKITLTLTVEQLNVVSDALVEMPFKSVVHLINDINRQVEDQMQKQKPDALSSSDLGYTRSGSGVSQ